MATNKSTQYAVRSKTPTYMNKRRCWVNIGVEKLQKAATEGKPYLFQFIIGEEKYLYSAPAEELQEKFDKYGISVMTYGGSGKYSFYVDYRSGEIFATVSDNNQDVVIALCDEREDIPDEIGDDVGDEPSSYFQKSGVERVKYEELTKEGKVIYNTQKLCSLLADYGYECHRISNEVDGADIIAYRNKSNINETLSGIDVLRIQVKSRLTIQKAYRKKDLYVSYPVEEGWYLVPHDEMIKKIVPKQWLKSESWAKGIYTIGTLSEELRNKLAPYLLCWPEGNRDRWHFTHS